MSRPHWVHSYEDSAYGPTPVRGCQFPECDQRAAYQWQRAATEEEIAAENSFQGQYGAVVRNNTGPHRVSVFACQEHAPSSDDMTYYHEALCPAPAEGCGCDASR